MANNYVKKNGRLKSLQKKVKVLETKLAQIENIEMKNIHLPTGVNNLNQEEDFAKGNFADIIKNCQTTKVVCKDQFGWIIIGAKATCGPFFADTTLSFTVVEGVGRALSNTKQVLHKTKIYDIFVIPKGTTFYLGNSGTIRRWLLNFKSHNT